MARTKTAQNNTGFASRAEAQAEKENVWQRFKSESKFNLTDMLSSLQDLAQNTFPEDRFNIAAYMEAILNSLTENISPEIGVKDFWLKMGEAGCQTIQVENGHLNFYKADKSKIDITPYTQPILFEAQSSFYKQRQLERKERIEAAKKQLAELRAEIKQKENL